MSPAEQVAQIRREIAARDAIYTLSVLERLGAGTATTRELTRPMTGLAVSTAANFIHRMKCRGLIECVGVETGPTGYQTNVWKKK